MSTTTGFYYEFLFLSTPSARRATHHHCYVPPRHWISIHALREEGDANSKYKVLGDMQISIHALREEGDTVFRAASMRGLDFYPRPPRGGRHRQFPRAGGRRTISIHALREEGDTLS